MAVAQIGMVRPLSIAHSYDLFIATIGYESRASHLARVHGRSALERVAFGFSVGHVLSYQANMRWYRSNGYQTSEIDDDEFSEACRSVLMAVAARQDNPRVLVDISSMTRRRIAAFVAVALEAGLGLAIDFAYSLARYSVPPRFVGPAVEFGPIADEFAGWPSNPEAPMTLFLGVGYETDRAVGTTEVLEPADLWLLWPRSPDPRYDVAVEKANADVKKLLRSVDHQIAYQVADPYDAFERLRSVMAGVTRGGRAIVIPFGPKIFALASVLLGATQPEVGVWRVSSGLLLEPLQRFASGPIVGLSVDVRKRAEGASRRESYRNP
jgi:hypothetical protein